MPAGRTPHGIVANEITGDRMTKRKEAKKGKKSFPAFLLKLAVAAAAVYLVTTFIGGQLKVAAKQRELEEIAARVEQQAEVNRELQRMMDTDDEWAYIERVAREKLGYVRPHERVYIDLTGQ